MSEEDSTLIDLVYETAEELDLWPKLFDICEPQSQGTARSVAATEFSPDKLIYSYLSDSSTIGADCLGVESAEANYLRHIQRVLRLNHHVESLQVELKTVRSAMNYLPFAMLTVDRLGFVIDQNNLAKKVVASTDILDVKEGVLIARTHDETLTLRQIIRKAFAETMQSSRQRSIKFFSPDDKHWLSVFSVPVDTQCRARAVACTLVVVPDSWSQFVSTTTIQELYQLTPAEVKLVLALVGGASPNEIAECCGLSQNTVRNQLKSIFSKTGTHRQAELVGLILSTPSYHQDSSEDGESKRSYGDFFCELDAFERRSNIVLSNGRSLEFIDVGDPEGEPIIYQHDAIFCWNWWSLIDKGLFYAMGLRLIVPFRPGYGETDGMKGFSYQTWAQDIKALADGLNLETFSVMGCSTGGPFAAYCAYAMPDRCSKLILVSSMGPIETLAELEHVRPAMSRLILGLAKYAPFLFARFFKLLLNAIQSDSLSYIKGYVTRWSAYDGVLVSNPVVLQSINDSVLAILQRGSSSMINESRLLVKPWGFRLEDIRVPTYIWRGEHDNAISRNLAIKLNKINGSVENIVPNKGHLLFLDHWREIFNRSVSNSACKDRTEIV